MSSRIHKARDVVLALLLISGAGLLIPPAVPASETDTGIISGTVKNEEGQSLAFANIVIQDLGQGTISSSDGEYVLANVAPGTHNVVVSYMGYATQISAIGIHAGQEVELDFVLTQTVFELEPVIVTGTPRGTNPLFTPQEIRTLSGREKVRMQSTSLGETIGMMPGVSNLSTGNVTGKPVIRGHTGERIRVLSDGIGMEYQQYGERHGPNVDPLNYERLEVVKGCACLLYGSDAIGGVINLIPPRPQFAFHQSPFVGGNLISQWSSANNEKVVGLRLKGAYGRLGITGSVVGRDAGNFKTPKAPTFAETGRPGDPKFTGEIRHTDYQQTTGSVALGYLADIGVISANYDYWWNENNYLLPTGGPIGLGLMNQTLSVKGQFVHPRLVFKPHVTYQRNRRRATKPGVSRAYLPDSAVVDLHLEVYTARFDMEHRGFGPLSGTVGSEFKHYDHRNIGLVPLQPTGFFSNIAVYAFEEIELDSLTLNAGIRLDHRHQRVSQSETNPLLPSDDERSYTSIASSLGASYRLTRTLTAAVNFTQGFRAPSFFNLYVYGLHGGVFAFQIGNPKLVPEKPLDFSASLRYRSPHLEASATGFFNYIKDYVYLFNDPGNPLAPPTSEFEFVVRHGQDDARIAGVDLSVEARVIDWALLKGDLSLITSEFLGGTHEGGELPLMPATRTSAEIRILLPTYKPLENPYTSIRVTYVSDKASAGYYEPFSQFDDGIGPDIPFGVASTESYALLDAGVGFDLRFHTVVVNLDIQAINLLGEQFRDFLDTYKGYALGPGRGVIVKINIPVGY